MKRSVRVSFISIFLLGMALSASSQSVIFGTNEAPPFSSERMPGKGIAGQLISAALKTVGYDVQIQFYPNVRLIQMLQNAELVGGIGSFKFENPNDFTYVDIFQFQLTFLYRKASFPKGFMFNSLSDFAPYKVGITDGLPQIPSFRAAGLSLDISAEPSTDIKKLVGGRVDFVSMPDLIGYSLLRQNGESIDNYGVTNPLSFVRASVAFPKKYQGSDIIVQNLINGMTMIKKNGTALKIMEDYYGVGKVPDWVFNF